MAPTLVVTARRVASLALSGSAKLLGGAAWVARRAAEAVKPGATPAEEVADGYGVRGRVVTPPQVPAAHEPGDPQAAGAARTSETHIAELARRPAPEVVDAVGRLSTDELRLLLEHEETHKRRRSVLEAIEKAAEAHAT